MLYIYIIICMCKNLATELHCWQHLPGKSNEKVTNQKMIKTTKPLSEQCSGGICSTSTVVDRGGGMRRSH